MGEPRVVAADDWCKAWKDKKTKWHLDYKHPLLLRHFGRFTQGKNCRRILLPFCGKSIDIVWLAELGHHVTAVDVSDIAMKHFAEEHNITFKEEPLPAGIGIKYTAMNSSLTFCVCNVLDFCREAVEGAFDAIWDRGGFSIVNVDERNAYVHGISSLLAPLGVYFLVVVVYDRTKIRGPPHCITEETVKELFGGKFCVEFVDSREALADYQRSWGLESFMEMLYHLTLKQIQST